MQRERRRSRLSGLLAAGVGLLGIAALVSNATIERLLLGEEPRNLDWGPTLFRVLLAGHGLVLAVGAIIAGRARSRFAKRCELPPVAETSSIRRTRWSQWGVLIVLSAAALGLRLWRLDTCLWFDELLTLVDFVRLPLGQIVTSFPNQNQHMLYSILAHLSIRVFGESAWALRLPSVLLGTGSIWVLYLLGRRLIGAPQALLACTLMMVSYHHIWFSQNARGYAGLLFFAILATWLFLEGLSQDCWRWWIGYAIAGCLGMWMHMTMAFVLAAHALLYPTRLFHPTGSSRQGVSWRVKKQIHWKPLAAWLLCATLTLQLHALALPEFLRTALHEVSLQSEWTNPIWVLRESLQSLKIGFSGMAVVLCGSGLIGIGWLSLLRRDWCAGLLMALPGVLGGLTMLVLGHNLWPRFFFFSMGFALLVVVHGAMTVPRLIGSVTQLRCRDDWAKAAGFVLTGFIIVASLSTVPRCYRLPKQDFTGARDFVERNRRPPDTVVTVGLAGKAYSNYFAPHWEVAHTRQQLDAVVRSHTAVWLVYTLPIELKAYHAEIWRVIETDFEIVKVFPGSLGGGEITVCQKRPGGMASNVSG